MRHALLPVLFLGGAFSGCRFIGKEDFHPIGTVEGSIAAAGARRVVVRNSVGEVKVEAGGEGNVTARAKVYFRGGEEALGRQADAGKDLKVVQSGEAAGDTIRIENAHLEASDHDDWKMDLTVTVPAGVDLRVEHGVGDCEVSGALGFVEVSLGVGEVKLRTDRLRGGAAKSGVGGVTVRVAAEGPSEDLQCETGVSDVSIALPAAFGGELSFETGVGDISLRDASGVRVERQVVSSSAKGRLGDGGPRVTAKTGTGDISFSRNRTL